MMDWLLNALGPIDTNTNAYAVDRPLVPKPQVRSMRLGVKTPAVTALSERELPTKARNTTATRAVHVKAQRTTNFERARTRHMEKPTAVLSSRAGLEALYRITRNQLSPVFFFPGSFEYRALRFLNESDDEERTRMLVSLRGYAITESLEALYQLLTSANEGREPRRIGRACDPRVDSLRARYLTRRPSAADTSSMTWYGALRWAGHRALDRNDLVDVPDDARKCVSVALAAAVGYRKVVELLPSWFPDGPPTKPSVQRWCALLVMRAAIEEKRFVPETVGYLVPPAKTKIGLKECVPIAAAFRCAVRERHEGGTVFLLTAILRMLFRRCLANAAKNTRGLGKELTAGAGAGVRDDEVPVLAELFATLADSGWNPWEEPLARRIQELLRVDLKAIERRLLAWLGDARPPWFWFIYVDAAVLTASLFALLGNSVSARLHLRGAKPRESSGLEYRFEGVAGASSDPESVWSVLEQSTRGLTDTVEDLLGTLDPNVALGTPIWALDERLGAIAPLALKEGRMRDLSAVRALFHRRELRSRLAPFWIFRKNEVRDVLRGLQWLGIPQPHPSEAEWLDFLEVLAAEASTQC